MDEGQRPKRTPIPGMLYLAMLGASLRVGHGAEPCGANLPPLRTRPPKPPPRPKVERDPDEKRERRRQSRAKTARAKRKRGHR